MTRASRLTTLLLVLSAALAACDGGAGTGPGAEPEPTPDPVATIRFARDTAYVRINTTAQLTASAQRASGQAVTGATFTWTSSDTAVATVSAEGLVTARAYGQVTVTASTAGKSAASIVWVTGTPGITVLSGAGAEDTIAAILPAPLVIEARDSLGVPLAQRPVLFRDGGMFDPVMLVAPLGGTEFSRSVVVTTDAGGRAAVRVRMGNKAGPATVLITPNPQLSGHAVPYTVRPGAPARLLLAPADTAVFAGRTVALRPAVTDRGGNVTAGAVAYQVSRGPLSVNGQTGLVTTGAYGAGWVTGRVGEAVDSVRVVAVPEGAFAFGSYFGGVGAMNFDGTRRQVIASAGTRPSWSPAGDRIVYQSTTSGGVLMVRALGGDAAPLPGTPPGASHEWAQYSPDGQWIYFFTAASGEPRKLWRIRPNGANLQLLKGNGAVGHPSPSPDGTRIAFFEEAGADVFIRVRNLATGQESGQLARGHSPTWSPTDDLIAFTELSAAADGGPRPIGITVMRSDGTDRRRVGQPTAWYEYSPRWSPDGRWIIASTAGRRVHLIELATGLTIELPQYNDVLESATSVSWKPGAPLP